MATYETVAEATRTFGRNAYLEVARKRLVESGEATEFLLVTRGFLDADGAKRWTRFVTLPVDDETRRWLAETLKDL